MPSRRSALFGAFHLDLTTGELTKHDRKIKLQNQPFQILALLLERAGDLVTHDEIRTKVWSNDTIVEFEHGVATAVKKLRQALGDDASRPRYVETLARRGYRWVAPVSWEPGIATTTRPVVAPPAPTPSTLVGRDGPLAALRECFGRVLNGQRQIVLITGEPGIGKTALVDFFQQQASVDVPHLRLGRGQCLDEHGGTE